MKSNSTCKYCGTPTGDIPAHYTVCEYLDQALGPVHPPKRKRANQCAYAGCNKMKVKNVAYCDEHRAMMANRAQNERLGHKRAGTK